MTAFAKPTKKDPLTNNLATTQAPSSGGNTQLKQGLKGMSFQQGQQALAPQGGGGAPVQMRGGKGKRKGRGGGGGQQNQQNQQTTPTPTTPPKEGTLTKIAKSLGEVEDIEGAFMGIGSLIDVFAPTAGQGFSGAIDVKIKPPGGNGFYLNLNFEGTAKRNNDDKLELEGKVGVVVGAAGKMTYFDGYVGARGMLAVKAISDSGFQALQLMGLGIHKTIAAWTTKGANWLFGQGYEEKVVEGMTPKTKGDKADALEYTGELGVEGGLGGGDEDTAGELKLAAGYRGKTTLSKEKEGDKKVQSETEHGFMAVLAAKAKALGVEFEGAIDAFLTKGKAPQWELKGELAADKGKLKDVMAVTKAVGDVFGGAVGVFRSGVSTYEKSKDGKSEPALWNGLRTAIGAVSQVPKATMAKAMVMESKGAPEGSKPAFELSLKFEGKDLKEFNLESVAKYEPGDTTKKMLETVGVELGGKTTTNLHNHKT